MHFAAVQAMPDQAAVGGHTHLEHLRRGLSSFDTRHEGWQLLLSLSLIVFTFRWWGCGFLCWSRCWQACIQVPQVSYYVLAKPVAVQLAAATRLQLLQSGLPNEAAVTMDPG